MAKIAYPLLLLLALNVGDYFAMGQSTIGDCSNDEQDFHKYCSDALSAVAKGIQSEFQNLKDQISHLADRVERLVERGVGSERLAG